MLAVPGGHELRSQHRSEPVLLALLRYGREEGQATEPMEVPPSFIYIGST